MAEQTGGMTMYRLFLVIDPDPAARVQFPRQLTTLFPGADVLVATSAEDGIQQLEAAHATPSLIFSELDLPGMSGLELLATLRQQRGFERTPVAVMSERTSDRAVLAAYRLGACAFLAKPVRPFELREVVRDFGHTATRMVAPLASGPDLGPRASAA